MTDRPGDARHDLLWLTEAGWTSVQRTADASGVQVWAAKSFPVVRRRRQSGDEPGAIPVAVAMPTSHGRARMAFQVTPEDVARAERLPSLQTVLSNLPETFLLRAHDVLFRADGIGLAPRVFGSAMWEHLTGLPYLHERSDLDLFWDLRNIVAPRAVVTRLVQALSEIEAGTAGPRLDGEIAFGPGAVQWRELLSANDTLLVKGADNVTLMPRSAFFEPSTARC